MMKVLHVISSGGMYGAEAVILSLSKEWNASGRDLSCVGVFAHAGAPVPTLYEVAVQAGIASELLPCHGQIDRSFPKLLRSLASRIGADVVHAHGYKADLYTYAAFRGVRERPAIISTCHTWYDNDFAVRVYGALDRWVLRSFDQVVAVSEDVRRRLLGAGVKQQKIHLVRNGVVVEVFADAQQRRKARRGVDSSIRVGLVGRLAPEKGVDVFLRAASEVAARFPTAQFLIAGDGPDRATLQALLKDLGLLGRAELVGRQDDMPGVFASLDLLVSASRHEGLPIALLEGMASGLPVVATSVGAVPQVVQDGQTGLLVEPEDPKALGEAIARLLADPDEREAFGVAGRMRVMEHFSARRMASDYMAVYRDALAARPFPAATPQREVV